MAKKKKISKRQKVFDFIDNTIDLLQENWKRYAVMSFFLVAFGFIGYLTFFWIDTIDSVRLVITYL
tara:strand:- start:332 stop:529 length:198 start_codon:yes stop_codon:yes gene_type:complete